MPSYARRSGPVPFVAKIKERSLATPETSPIEEVRPLWTTKEIGAYLVKSKNALSEFLNKTPTFPAFKIGSEWRADPEEVREWVRRQRVHTTETEAAG